MSYNNSYCKGCIYCTKLSVGLCCEYFLKTNKRRPCPAGSGCTVKETGRNSSAWRHENEAAWEKVQKERERERDRLRREKKRKAKMRTLVCPICGKEFQTSDSRKMYCSKECGYEAQRRRWKEKTEMEKQNPRNKQTT